MVLHLAQYLRRAGRSAWAFRQLAQAGELSDSEDMEEADSQSSSMDEKSMLSRDCPWIVFLDEGEVCLVLRSRTRLRRSLMERTSDDAERFALVRDKT